MIFTKYLSAWLHLKQSNKLDIHEIVKISYSEYGIVLKNPPAPEVHTNTDTIDYLSYYSSCPYPKPSKLKSIPWNIERKNRHHAN